MYLYVALSKPGQVLVRDQVLADVQLPRHGFLLEFFFKKSPLPFDGCLTHPVLVRWPRGGGDGALVLALLAGQVAAVAAGGAVVVEAQHDLVHALGVGGPQDVAGPLRVLEGELVDVQEGGVELGVEAVAGRKDLALDTETLADLKAIEQSGKLQIAILSCAFTAAEYMGLLSVMSVWSRPV